MNEVVYKGYAIESFTDQRLEDHKWTINVAISNPGKGDFSIKQFSAKNTFTTREEAIKHCIIFGKQIIDGDFEECTLDDL